ncbi:unnamed protein product [Trichogramma brassicae]|uniref:Uncharacterized protein n=1 Tax=Trichogramma brassicae TaxID=86971 RepID=A0A6H5J383_9HYME|nr:unnamed protein product [Trichogramma brassicae]
MPSSWRLNRECRVRPTTQRAAAGERGSRRRVHESAKSERTNATESRRGRQELIYMVHACFPGTDRHNREIFGSRPMIFQLSLRTREDFGVRTHEVAMAPWRVIAAQIRGNFCTVSGLNFSLS